MDNNRLRTRRYDIDWLRVLLFALLIWYHYYAVMHIRLGADMPGMWLAERVSTVMHQWRLPALFMISGMGTAFAFRHRSWRQYLRERLVRLLIPLLFVVVVLNWGFRHPVAKTKAFISSFPFPNMDVFQHMWFIYILLIYSIVLIPLFVHVRSHPGGAVVRFTRTAMAFGHGLGLLLAPPLLLAGVGALFKPWMAGPAGFWWETPWFAVFFVFGYLAIVAGDEYFGALEASRYLLTIVTPLLTFLFIRLLTTEAAPHLINGGWVQAGYAPFSIQALLWMLLLAFNAWFWCLLIFAWGARFLHKPSRPLSYLNQAVYPAYIVHFNAMWVVIMLLAMAGLDRSFASFIVGIPLEAAICLLMFELARRGKWVGVLFGIKNSASQGAVERRSALFDLLTMLAVAALLGGSALYYYRFQ